MATVDPKASWADDASSDEEEDTRVRADTAQSEDDHAAAASSAPAPEAPVAEPQRAPAERRERAPRPERQPVPMPDVAPFKAFVGNLPFEACDEQHLTQFFDGLKVIGVALPTMDGKSRGFAYVEFETRDDLVEAIKLNNKELQGRSVHVDVAAQPRKHKNDRRQDRGPRGDRKDRGERGFGSGFRRRDPAAEGEQKSDVPAVRTKLAIAPRTKPIEAPTDAARNSGIFGSGKPREAKEDDLTGEAARRDGAARRGERRERTERGERTDRGGRGDRAERKKPDQATTERKKERKERRKPAEMDDEARAAAFQRSVDALEKQKAEDREKESKNQSASKANAFSMLVSDEEDD